MITKRDFGVTADGRKVTCFKITAENGMEAEVLDYGVTLRTLMVPNKNGELTDVVLGYDTIEEYENNDGYLGATVGRFANRIAKGKFTLNQKEYQLAINNGENHLHGGIKGFSRYVWNAEEIENGIAFSMVSPDGDEGYPGTLTLTVKVILKDNGLTFDYYAVTDKDTILNLTNHTYFNLNGKGDIHGHYLTINADRFAMNDKGCLPTGELPLVENTAMDFRTEHTIGERVDSDEPCVAYGGGYDNNYCLNGNPGVIARANESGIVMTLTTDQPGVQLYTANQTSERGGKGGVKFGRRHGFCLETQHYPDCINHPEWPTCILRAGEEFRSYTTYTFGIYKA